MSNAAGTKQLPVKAIIAWVVTILVPVILLLIPTSETYTSELRIFFALTLCAILMFAFDQVHSAIPALILPLAYALTGLVDFGTAMAPWTQPVVWIVFGCFLIAAIYDRVGILKRIGYWAIIRTGASYKGIIYGFFLAGLILNRPVLGPVLAGVVGLIPNCAASVTITQLYISGVISLGAMMSGLLVGAGVGLLVLFRVNPDKKENLKIVGILYVIGVLAGIVINWL